MPKHPKPVYGWMVKMRLAIDDPEEAWVMVCPPKVAHRTEDGLEPAKCELEIKVAPIYVDGSKGRFKTYDPKQRNSST